MSTNSSGWSSLQCHFFGSVCSRTLGDYFHTYGFEESSRDSVGGVVYRRDNIFVEMSYEAETFPRYSPTVIIGAGRSAHDAKWRLTAVPMWFIVAAEGGEANYSSWTFNTEEELANVLARIRTDVLEKYARPLWRESSALRRQIKQFRQEP